MNQAFHGGCADCTNDISICPECKYFNCNWTLPDMNPAHIKHEQHLSALRLKALEAQHVKYKTLLPEWLTWK